VNHIKCHFILTAFVSFVLTCISFTHSMCFICIDLYFIISRHVPHPDLQYFTLPRLFHMESMEWRVDSMECKMESMECKMESMECKMESMDCQMDSMEFPGGFHTMFRWIPWNGRWIPYLFQMDSIPFPGWSPYGIQVIS
jgi:hypothetical protein